MWANVDMCDVINRGDVRVEGCESVRGQGRGERDFCGGACVGRCRSSLQKPVRTRVRVPELMCADYCSMTPLERKACVFGPCLMSAVLWGLAEIPKTHHTAVVKLNLRR